MRTLFVRNVEEAYYQGVLLLRDIGEPKPSRAGDVYVAPFPVMTVYSHPRERVLFHPKRDANPFFHLFEALWMLAGRDDATWLDRFVSDFSERFAEKDGAQHGAYGARWKHHFGGLDQLHVVVDSLTRNPDDRRVVIAMWDPEFDLGMPTSIKDLPCNTHLYPRIVDGALDLTILCRSNDIIWGAYGSNAVHFSILQEYLAGRIGVGVGKLYQFSNNWHGYHDVLAKVSPDDGAPWYENYYVEGKAEVVSMGDNWDLWDQDLHMFMQWSEVPQATAPMFHNWWFSQVAVPLYIAHYTWKGGHRHAARSVVSYVPDCDWKTAAEEWMDRRLNKE